MFSLTLMKTKISVFCSLSKLQSLSLICGHNTTAVAEVIAHTEDL